MIPPSASLLIPQLSALPNYLKMTSKSTLQNYVSKLRCQEPVFTLLGAIAQNLSDGGKYISRTIKHCASAVEARFRPSLWSRFDHRVCHSSASGPHAFCNRSRNVFSAILHIIATCFAYEAGWNRKNYMSLEGTTSLRCPLARLEALDLDSAKAGGSPRHCYFQGLCKIFSLHCP